MTEVCQVEIRGPAVLLLGPGDEVTDPEGLRRLGFTVVQQRVTGEIGPCALKDCAGTILRVSVPVENHSTGERSLHTVNVCSQEGCRSTVPFGEESVRQQLIGDQRRYVKE